MQVHAVPPPRGMAVISLSHRRVQVMVSALLVMSTLVTGLSLAPAAIANSADNLRSAVTSARPSCGAMRTDPIAEKVAQNISQSTDLWIDHTARAVPVPDPLPVLKDLGYRGNKAVMLVSAGHTDAVAIKNLILEGFDKIPDCSYTDYGVNIMQNQQSKWILATLVMAGA